MEVINGKIIDDEGRIYKPVLKRCPFCGMNAAVVAGKDPGSGKVECGACMCSTPVFDNALAAVGRWNKRV